MTQKKREQAEEAPTHRLEALAKQLGAADEGTLAAVLAGHDERDLVALGEQIASPRIVTDDARLYSEAFAFWSQASDAQKTKLRGFSLPLLALAVEQALTLERMSEQQQSQGQHEATQVAASEQEAKQAFQAGILLRDQAYTAMREAAGRQGGLRAELDGVVGTAETADRLASGLSGLEGLLRRWLKQGGALGQRLTLASLDASYADELKEAAQKVRTTSTAARRRPSGKVTQAQLDRQDGVCLLLLGQIIRAFERAHDLDATIPRLVPIATRRLFSRRSPPKPPAAPVDDKTG